MFNEEEYKKLLEQERQEIEQQEQQAKKDGYNVKYTFWVHPSIGDDFCVDMYSSKKLNKREIQKCKNDFKNNFNADLVEEPTSKEI